MASAAEIRGTVFKNGSATLLARVVGADGSVLTQSDVSTITYTVALLDDTDPDSEAAVDNHEDVACVVADTIFDTLQDDDLWDVDHEGYNFKHVLDVSSSAAFATAGRSYRITFTITPAAGQVILVRFRVYCL